MAANAENVRAEVPGNSNNLEIRSQESDSFQQKNDPIDLIEPKTEITLSKRQLKKLAKQQKWLDNKPAKRLKEKEIKKKKRILAKERGDDLGPSRKKLKSSKMEMSSCKIRVVIDMSLDNLMEDRDMCKCIKQLQRCYSINRRASAPLQFYLTSLNGKSRDIMSNIAGYLCWDVHYKKDSYLEVFDKSSIVYLTSESPNILTELDESKVYVIGGLVDHNKHKGICYHLAKENSIEHGQLPLDNYIDMKTRKVLTVDQVFEILLRFSESKNWQEAFLKVIPTRKGAQAKINTVEKYKESTHVNLDKDNSNFDKKVEILEFGES